MTSLPEPYRWLSQLNSLPRMITEAIRLFGTLEAPGKRENNPIIMGWAAEVSEELRHNYYADEVPWCGLFMAVVAKRAGKTPPAAPLWALNWNKFGIEAGQPMLGDILTFQREGGGHVSLYVGEDKACYHVLGGNQSDQVCFTRIAKGRLKAARRPLYQNQPETVKPYILGASGKVSQNEA